MLNLKLNEIINLLPAELVCGSGDIQITGITNNSRNVKEGYLFICIKGFKTDGHKYIADAVKNGAAAVAVTEDTECLGAAVIKVDDARIFMAQASCILYGNPSHKMKMIGVTGTNGKTTVTTLIKNVLDFTGEKTGLIGTNETVIGSERLPAEHTTPESCDLQRILAEMVEKGVKYCVMEVSSHALELHRIDGTRFDIGIFTNLTHDHLDLHGTMENYLNAKAKLFDMAEIGIINTDDSYANRLKIKNKITYSIDSDSDYKAYDINLSERGVIYKVNNLDVRVLLPGRFSVYNSVAAIAALKTLGINDDKILKGLMVARGAKGRAEIVHINKPYKVMIDFAHTPDGLYNILSTVKEFCKGRLITVFGAAGDRDSEKRPEMGEIVGKYADFAIITSDNPASENPADIIKQVESGMKKTSCKYICIEDRKQAIHYAMDMAHENDFLLLAGKGHETYQIMSDGKHPFSESQIVKEYAER